jgi:hypothetical protein
VNVKEHLAEAEEILDIVRETSGPTAMEALAHVMIAMVKVQIAANNVKGS